ncbi:MAG TPA: hypothetical protein DEQ40_00310, partial [Oxalobacteraceae bacterium]|nr:hypothetical protein [Oxalobacteraceae bacterium]
MASLLRCRLGALPSRLRLHRLRLLCARLRRLLWLTLLRRLLLLQFAPPLLRLSLLLLLLLL